MDLLWAVWAKDYTDHEDGSVTLWRTYEWLTYGAEEYPANEELLLVGRLRGESKEFGTVHGLEVRFKSLDFEEVISSVENEIIVPTDQDLSVSIWHFVYRLSATFANDGQYAADVIIDGKTASTLPMYVWTYD